MSHNVEFDDCKITNVECLKKALGFFKGAQFEISCSETMIHGFITLKGLPLRARINLRYRGSQPILIAENGDIRTGYLTMNIDGDFRSQIECLVGANAINIASHYNREIAKLILLEKYTSEGKVTTFEDYYTSDGVPEALIHVNEASPLYA